MVAPQPQQPVSAAHPTVISKGHQLVSKGKKPIDSALNIPGNMAGGWDSTSSPDLLDFN